MVITLDEETIRDIELAEYYACDESFRLHCGDDLIRLYHEQCDN